MKTEMNRFGKVAVLFGGKSAEREVSLKSAVSLTCEISGARREVVYREALRLAAAQENGET